jgi:hypothetical protein
MGERDVGGLTDKGLRSYGHHRPPVHEADTMQWCSVRRSERISANSSEGLGSSFLSEERKLWCVKQKTLVSDREASAAKTYEEHQQQMSVQFAHVYLF